MSSSPIGSRGDPARRSSSSNSVITFAKLWRTLATCYEKNERDMSLAYGNHLAEFAQLFGETLAELPVRTVCITNQPLASHETRESVLHEARENHVFHAVFVLANKRPVADTSLELDELSSFRDTFADGHHSSSAAWLGESIFFRNFDESRFEQLQDYLSQTKTRPAFIRQAIGAFRDLPAQQPQQQRPPQEQRSAEVEAKNDLESYNRQSMIERAAAVSDQVPRRAAATFAAVADSPEQLLLRSEHSRMDNGVQDGAEDDVDRNGDEAENDDSYDEEDDGSDETPDDVYFDYRDECLDDSSCGGDSYDSDDDRVAFGDLAFYDNYKKPAKPFQRPMNTSPSKWIAEIYKCFFNLFYQEVRSLPVAQRFSSSQDSDAFYGR